MFISFYCWIYNVFNCCLYGLSLHPIYLHFFFCSLFICHIIAIFLYSAIALPYIFNSCFHFVCICRFLLLVIIIIYEWNKLELKHLTNDNNINTANTVIFLYKNLIPFMFIPHLFLDWHSVNCALSMFIVLVLSFCLLLLFSVSTIPCPISLYVYLNFIYPNAHNHNINHCNCVMSMHVEGKSLVHRTATKK